MSDRIFDWAFLEQIDPGRRVLEFVKPALEIFRSETFAPDLSLAMVLSAILLAMVFWFIQVRPALKALSARIRFLRKCRTGQAFVDNLYQFDLSMREVKFLGHSWSKFLEACLLRDPHVQSSIEITERPANYINLRDAEHFGLKLKWFHSLSGVYVGVGLLFTFIGLVAALYFSSAAIQAVVNAGAEVSVGERGAEVQRALAQLLNTATFKFLTSIAGLGCSIALAIFDRKCKSKLDDAFDDLCSELERCSVTITPEFLADRQYQVLVEIALRLKRMSADRERAVPVAAIVAPPQAAAGPAPAEVSETLARIEAGFAASVAALTATVQQALTRLPPAQSAPQLAPPPPPPPPIASVAADAVFRDMAAALAGLSDRMDAAAGRVETAIAASTRTITAAIQQANGDNLASSLTRAVESGFSAARLPLPTTDTEGEAKLLNADALVRIEAAVRDGTAAMTTVAAQVSAFGAEAGSLKRELAALFHQLSEAVRSSTQATADTMTSEFHRLAERENRVTRDLEATTRGAAQELEQTGAKVAGQIVDDTTQLLTRVGAVIETLGQPIDRLSRTMDTFDGRIAGHLAAFDQLTRSMREAEQCVVGAANALNAATLPLTRVGEGMSEAMAAMASGVDATARSLGESQQAGQQLADELRTTLESLTAVWKQHEARFSGVDESVTRILGSIIGHAEAHGVALRDHVVAIDTHLSHTVNTLAANIDSLQEVAGDLTAAAQGLERFGATLAAHPAATKG